MVVVLASMAIVPEIVVRIPRDYFTHEHRPPSRWGGKHRVVNGLLRVGKNVLGLLLVVAGVAMLALPGQGVLTLLAGVFLLDVPGKYRLQKWLIRQPWVKRPVDWLRERRGKEPLEVNGS